MSTKSRYLLSVCSLFGLLFSLQASQAQDAVQRIVVHKFQVNPGTEARFEEVVGKFKQAAVKAGAGQQWLASQSMVGGSGHYNIVTLYNSWEEIGTPRDVMGAAYSEREVTRIAGLVEDSVSKHTSTGYTNNPNLSRPLPSGEQAVGVLLIDFKLQPNMGQQFREYVMKVNEATGATTKDIYWSYLEPGIGADGPLIAVYIKEWADMDTPAKPVVQRLIEHFGEQEGARLFESRLSIVEGMSMKLHRTRADLAHQPE